MKIKYQFSFALIVLTSITLGGCKRDVVALENRKSLVGAWLKIVDLPEINILRFDARGNVSMRIEDATKPGKASTLVGKYTIIENKLIVDITREEENYYDDVLSTIVKKYNLFDDGIFSTELDDKVLSYTSKLASTTTTTTTPSIVKYHKLYDY